jgi:hypothetical protein
VSLQLRSYIKIHTLKAHFSFRINYEYLTLHVSDGPWIKLTVSSPSVNRLLRKGGSLDVSKPFGSPQLVKGTSFFLLI